MAELVIKDTELQELNAIVGEMPFKIAVPIFNFFTKVIQTRQNEALQVLKDKKTEDKPASQEPTPPSDAEGKE